MITVDALVLGGGLGKRFSDGSTPELPKQFQNLGNAPVMVHAIKALMSLDCLRQIVVVTPKEYVKIAQEMIDLHFERNTSKVSIQIVTGGERRQDSSRLGLEALEKMSPLPTRVLIHDACRPYLSDKFLTRIKASLLDRSYGAWVPVTPVVETLKKVENHQVIETVDRAMVHRVQTPQIFEYSVIRTLVEKAQDMPDLNFTDDASLCEYYGIPVGVFEGDVRNIKLTYDFELQTLSSMMGSPKEIPCAPESGTTFTV